MMDPPVGQPPVSAVVVLTRATLPAVALIAMVPMASGVGRLVVPPVPWASWIRYFVLAARVPEMGVTCQVVPVAEAYCTDQPVKLTGLPERL